MISDPTVTADEARRELYEIIRKEVPFEEKARDALELGRQYLDADNGHLTRIDRETDHWEAMVSTDSVDGQFPPGLELELGTTYCRRTIAADSQIALHDAPNQGWETDPAFETHGLHCYHGTTLVLNGEPYGTVCFVAEDPRSERFSDGETMFAELITRLLERELEREQHEAELTRQANLTIVLNRVLRHNLRNDMAVIRGFTQLMAEKLDDDSAGETALHHIDKLITLSQKARELDGIVTADYERESAEIVAMIENIVREVTGAHSNATVSVEYDERITADVLPSLQRALEELIENAVKHSGEHPNVTITIENVPDAVEIRIRDEGPGLADHEADVLETGTETQLTHGTGLGLWIAYWIVTGHGGTVEATTTENGTTMTVSIPRIPSTNAQRQASTLTHSRDQYQAAFEEAANGMLIINDDAQIVDANEKATEIYGGTVPKLLGRSIPEFLPADFNFEAAWCDFQNAEDVCDTVTIDSTHGEKRLVEYAATSDVIPGYHLIISRKIER